MKAPYPSVVIRKLDSVKNDALLMSAEDAEKILAHVNNVWLEEFVAAVASLKAKEIRNGKS